MKRTKIIATLGPACDDIEIMEQLVRNGVNVFRMNFSHGSREEHGERIRKIKLLREKLQQPIGILLDTKGPESRLKTFEDDAITLAPGDKFTPVSYTHLDVYKRQEANLDEFGNVRVAEKDVAVRLADALKERTGIPTRHTVLGLALIHI